MTYRLTIIPRAVKDFEQLEGKLFIQVAAAVNALAENPHRPTRKAVIACACGIFAFVQSG